MSKIRGLIGLVGIGIAVSVVVVGQARNTGWRPRLGTSVVAPQKPLLSASVDRPGSLVAAAAGTSAPTAR
jgi:hypothetical protein